MDKDHHLSRDNPKGPWLVKLTIPSAVRPMFDGKLRFTASTRTTDIKAARAIRDELLVRWRQAIQEARDGAPVAHLLEDLDGEAKDRALEALRETAIDIAIGTGNRAPLDAIDAYSDRGQALGRHYDTWVRELETRVSPATLRTYLALVPPLFEQFPSESDLRNRRQVHNRLTTLGGSANTQRTRLAAWKDYIAHFERVTESDRDLLALFSGIRIATPKTYRPKEHIPIAQVRRLVEEADPDMSDLIVLAYYTGARVSELCSSPTLEGNRLTLHGTKTVNAERTIPLHPKATQALSRWLSKPRKSGYYSRKFSRLKSSLGFPKTQTLHSLRHTFVNELSARLVNPAVLAKLLGHAPGSFTERTYSGTVAFEHLEEAIALLPDL